MQDFENAMDEDFNTSKALSVLFDLANTAQKLKDTDKNKAIELISILLGISSVLGFDFSTEKELGSDLTKGLMDLIIEIRKIARSQKNWELSDKIRDDLTNLGITLKDTKDGKTVFEINK